MTRRMARTPPRTLGKGSPLSAAPLTEGSADRINGTGPARSGPGLLPAFLLGAGLLALLPVSIAIAVTVGASSISPGTVAQVMLTHLVPGDQQIGSFSFVQDKIIWDLRVPRVLLAAVIGAGLAVTGTVLQTILRNPLGEPGLLGISQGAALAAVALLVLGPAALGGVSLSAAAFVGALLAALATYLVGQIKGRLAPTRLILGGVTLSFLFFACMSYLILQTGSSQAAQVVLTWTLGTLRAADWSDLGLPTAAMILAMIVMIAQARPLNALLLGEESATSVGVNVNRLRVQAFVVTSLLTGAAVAVSGVISFVGLIIPHIVRILVGSDHRRVLIISALMGAVFLIWVDAGSRALLAPKEIPLSVLTAAIGAPVFFWLMRREGVLAGMER